MVVINTMLVDVEIETENGLNMEQPVQSLYYYTVLLYSMYVQFPYLGCVLRYPQLVGVQAVMSQY